MADFQAQLQEYLDAMNKWFSDFQENATQYFQGCSQTELYLWGGNGVGLILIVVGIVLFFI